MTEAGTESTEAETESEEVLPEGMYRSELTNELIDESLKIRDRSQLWWTMSLLHCHITVYHRQTLSMMMMNSTLNGRITRFMVLVKDWENIKQLGSIRSVRPTNIPDCIRVECSHLS